LQARFLVCRVPSSWTIFCRPRFPPRQPRGPLSYLGIFSFCACFRTPVNSSVFANDPPPDFSSVFLTASQQNYVFDTVFLNAFYAGAPSFPGCPSFPPPLKHSIFFLVLSVLLLFCPMSAKKQNFSPLRVVFFDFPLLMFGPIDPFSVFFLLPPNNVFFVPPTLSGFPFCPSPLS